MPITMDDGQMTEPDDEDLLTDAMPEESCNVTGLSMAADDDEPQFAERETTIAGSARWAAPAADQAIWSPSTSPWDRPEFRAQLDWLSRRLSDAADTRKAVAALPAEAIREDRRDRLLAGSTRQIAHASHLRRQILGTIVPYCGKRGLEPNLTTDIDGLLASLFGNDPRAAFLSAMTLNGIVPSSAVIAAGAALQIFHVVGDPVGTRCGCPFRCSGSIAMTSPLAGSARSRLAPMACGSPPNLRRASASRTRLGR